MVDEEGREFHRYVLGEIKGQGPPRSSLELAVINLKAAMIKVLDDPKVILAVKLYDSIFAFLGGQI